MKTQKKKSWKSLAKDLSKIRKQPLKQEQIDELNKTFEKDIEQEEKNSKIKKIARGRNSEVDA